MTIKIRHHSVEMEVNLPNRSNNKLISIIIRYFQGSSHLLSLSPESVKKYVTTVELFHEFIIDFGYLDMALRDIPASIFNTFSKWCAERRTIIRGNGEGARARSITIMGLIQKALEEKLDSEWSRLEKVQFQKLKESFNIQKRPSEKRPPLIGLAGSSCIYSDKQLFQSLRYVCAWIILEEKRQKNRVLEFNGVKDILRRIVAKHTPQELLTMQSFSHFNEILKGRIKHPSHLESVYLLKELVEKVNEIEDIYVKESLLRSMSLLQFNTLSGDKIQDLSRRMEFYIDTYKHVSFNESLGTKKGNRVTPQFKRFTPFDLLYTPLSSVLCMINLLASERVQHAGILNITLDDVIINICPHTNVNSLEIVFEKQRSKSFFSTLTYKSNDKNPLIYEAYKCYFDQISDFQSNLPLDYKGTRNNNKKSINITNKLIPQLRSGIAAGSHYHIADSIMFSLLADENSLLRKKINMDAGKEAGDYVAPFCWLLNRIIQSRTGSGKRVNEDSITADAKAKKRESLFLSTEYIGNSRIALEQGVVANEVVESENNELVKKSFTLNSSLSDIAFLTAHNTDTKHNVYLDRLPEKEKIEFIESIPVRVGELMEIDALKLLKFKKHNKVYSVIEAKKILGLLNVDEIYQEVDEEVIGLDGEIKYGEDVLYIATPENSALIIKHIEYLESEIPRLLQNHPEARGRVMDALLSCYNLKLIINKFPKNIVSESIKIAERLSNNLFPPLI